MPQRASRRRKSSAYPRCMTKTIAEEFDRDTYLRVTFWETIFYILFVIIATIVIYGPYTESAYYMTSALKRQFTETRFTSDNDIQIRFEQIKTVADFWYYLNQTLLDSLYWEFYYSSRLKVAPARADDRKVLFEDKLLGLARLRQVRIRNDSCTIHPFFRRLFLSCFSQFNPDEEDKEPFGLETETAWVYNTAQKTRQLKSTGKITSYTGGGYYVDLPPTSKEAAGVIKELLDNLWITRGTRAVFVDFSVYNGNLNLFCVCKLIFEMPPTGGVIPSSNFNTVILLHGYHKWFQVYTSLEIVLLIFVAYLFFRYVRELVYFRLKMFKNVWNYINLFILLAFVACGVIRIVYFPQIEEAVEKLKDDAYGNLEREGTIEMTYVNIQAFCLFFIYINIFQYLNFNKTMAQLNNTLERCASDTLAFSSMFFIIFFAYAELGYLLFGSQVEQFRNFGVSMFTLLQTILGHFEYSWIEEANRVLAPIYFLSYIFLVFFVLLNMFLAIINDSYADVKTELAITPDKLQLTEYIKGLLTNCLIKLGCKSGSTDDTKSAEDVIDQVRSALKKAGFSPMEIEMFLARYNIDPNAKVRADTEEVVAELERQLEDTSKGAGTGGFNTSPIQMSDFLAQQERLDEIEQITQQLSDKIDDLLEQLKHLHDVQTKLAKK